MHEIKSPSANGVASARQPATAQELRLWGLTVRELHDRRWASRSVQIVRPGGAEVELRGPRLYILLGAEDFVLFRINPILKRLNWMKPRAMRLRLVDRQATSYMERVLTDNEDRFIAIRREYFGRTRSTLRLVVTGEAKLARMWRDSAGGREGWRAMRDRIGRDRWIAEQCSGRILSTASPSTTDDCLEALLEQWSEPGASLDGVYEPAPGALVHETARPPQDTRLVGRVWIGAGVRLRPGSVVIGPRVLADAPGAVAKQRPPSWEAALYPGWKLTPKLRGTWFRHSKRLFDIAFSSAVLVATAPIYPIVMLAILLEDGWPPFFAHMRQTRRGRVFPCYKFRTMRKDAEQIKAELASKNQADGPQFFIEKDPRLLRIGKTLRRFQIDELPQFWNVLLGHMSVVGPRPSPDKENQFSPAWREARLSVRPGVTGLWQVSRTREPETDFQEWIRYDLEYVQHESWRLDLWIIFKTVEKIIRG
ncbi:MAG: sugar transferase [Phycisphaeraceae bacterium]|nr:MAG: sugar transferase [Phycisphaeraceae bacterium]